MRDDGPLRALPLIELRDIHKVYETGGGLSVEVLRGLSLTIRTGEFVAVMGASGSGKSTLMNLLGLLDKPSRGNTSSTARMWRCLIATRLPACGATPSASYSSSIT